MAHTQLRRLSKSTEGTPLPLGVSWIESEQAFNLALHTGQVAEARSYGYSVSGQTLPQLHTFDPQKVRKRFDWAEERAPHHTSDAILYELHARGFTKNLNSGVDPAHAGTCAGLVEKIPCLKNLGITVVELLLVFQRVPQEGDYWGYVPLNFFAPHAQYASARHKDSLERY